MRTVKESLEPDGRKVSLVKGNKSYSHGENAECGGGELRAARNIGGGAM